MTARTASTFLGTLKRSNLLPPRKLLRIERAVVEAGLEDRADLVARGLEQAGLLTPWQAKQLLHGRRAFFLGPYKLLSRIGAGGMGTVFKAERSPDGKIVALKVVPQERLAAPGAAARFRREMQAAVRLKHRHIVRAFQAQRIGDFHFLVMEFVDGADLSWYAKRAGKLPIAWACECVRQAAIGLHFAHEKGLVHRDVKPANLLVTIEPETGRPWVKVVDFGLARFTAETAGEGELTGSGQILGTPDYIAPEQARRTRTADVRADVYSLGCTLYRLIGGRLPFEGETPIERLLARYTQDAPPLRSVRPETPEELEAIVARMLAREPAARFATPGEAARALEPFAMGAAVAVSADRSSLSLTGGLPFVAPPARGDEPPAIDEPVERNGHAADHAPWEDREPAADRTGPFLELLSEAHEGTQPNDGPTRSDGDGHGPALDLEDVSTTHATRPAPPRWLWTVVAALAIVAAVGVWLWNARRAPTASGGRGPATALAPPVDSPGDRGGEAAPHDAPETRLPTESTAPSAALGPVAPPRDPVRLEKLGAALQKLLPGYPEAALREAARALSDPNVAADWNAPGWEAFRRQWSAAFGSTLPPELRRAAFDPPPIAVYGDLRFTHGAEIAVARFSPDGRLLATADRGGLVRVWDAGTGELRREFDAAPNVYDLDFSATGARLAALGYTDVWDDALEVWDLTTGERDWAHEGGDGAPLAMAFDPRDDDRLWCGDAAGRLVARNVRSGRSESETQAHSRLLSCLTFVSPDGPLATAGADGLKLWTTAPEVRLERPLPTFAGESLLLSRWALAADPSGARLAFLGPEQKLWLVPVDGAPPTEVALADAQPQDVAFSPDGASVLIWGRRAGSLVAWSPETQRFTIPPGVRGEDGAAVAASATRRTLALSRGGRVRLVDSATGDEILPPSACRGRVLALAATAGSGLVAVDEEGRVCRWIDATKPPVVRRFAGGRFAAAALSGDGARLLYITSDRRVSIVDLFADGTPRTLAEGIDPREPIALSPDGRWAAWVERRPDEPLAVMVAETAGGQRGAFPLDGPTTGLGFVSLTDDSAWVAASVPGRSARNAEEENFARESRLIVGTRDGDLTDVVVPVAPRLALVAELGERTLVTYGRSRIALMRLGDGQKLFDRDLGEPTVAAAFDDASPDRVVVALANSRVLVLDATTGPAGKLDLSPAASVATFARPKLVVESRSGDVLISDDNGVVYRFRRP